MAAHHVTAGSRLKARRSRKRCIPETKCQMAARAHPSQHRRLHSHAQSEQWWHTRAAAEPRPILHKSTATSREQHLHRSWPAGAAHHFEEDAVIHHRCVPHAACAGRVWRALLHAQEPSEGAIGVCHHLQVPSRCQASGAKRVQPCVGGVGHWKGVTSASRQPCNQAGWLQIRQPPNTACLGG